MVEFESRSELESEEARMRVYIWVSYGSGSPSM